MNQQICDAIDQRHTLSFRYQNTFGVRRVEPHAYGVTAAGHEVLLTWQLSGPSESAPFQPGWRVFSVADLSRIVVNADPFGGPRDGYVSDDDVIKEVYCQL